MSKMREIINSLPLIRTIHKIFLIYAASLKLQVKLTEVEHRLSKDKANRFELASLEKDHFGVLQDKREQKLIVSLTSFGERINSVHIAIESLMRQSLMADEIILWLSEDEFSHKALPQVLKLQEKRGLTIRFTKDVGSYKKLVPALKSYPDALIVTTDDDFMYPLNHLDRLYKAWLKDPNHIHCCRAHFMGFSGEGDLLPYNEWENDLSYPEPSALVFPTGCAGILYFPGCFDTDVSDEKLFLELCPSADDIWFKYMSLLKGVKCKVLEPPPSYARIEAIPGLSGDCLWDVNFTENDIQLGNVSRYYQERLDSLLQ